MVAQVSHAIAFAQMRRAVCQRQLSFLFIVHEAADIMQINVNLYNACLYFDQHSLRPSSVKIHCVQLRTAQ